MKKTFVLVAFLLAILTGCQKDQQEKNSNRTISPLPKVILHSIGGDMSGNDSVGSIHNAALGSLIEYSKMNGGINKDECYIFLDQYYPAPSNINSADNYRYAQMVLSKQPIDSDEILIRLPYGKTSKQFLKSIIDIVLNQQVLDLQVLNGRLEEVATKARQSLTGDELSAVLQLGSVARHSAKFWKTYYGDHPIPAGEGLWKVLAAIHADNCGYLVGAICGDAGFWSAYFSATVGFSILGDRKVEI